MTHTPPPWKIVGESDLPEIDDLMIVASQVGPDWEGEDIYICNIGPDFSPLKPVEGISEQNLANARLIAAAPEMFELLKQIYEHSAVGVKQIEDIFRKVGK